MSWNWKKAIEGADSDVRAPKRNRAGRTKKAETPADTRTDAGIVLQSTAPHAGGRPEATPQLLYGKKFPCGFCHGTGQLANESLCPVCRGDGEVSVAAPVVGCAFCHGRGQVPPRSGLTCCVCKGTGVVAVSPPIQACPECRGRGKQRGKGLYCSRCRGTGVVSLPKQCTDSGGVSTVSETQPTFERMAS